MESSGQEIREWLREWQGCVRAVDFERARALFAPDVVGFGTYGSMLHGIDQLQRGQWEQIWPRTRDFTWDFDTLHCGARGAVAWALVRWRSVGFDPTGAPFERGGRATIIFERRDGSLLGVHTHVSLDPRPSPQAY